MDFDGSSYEECLAELRRLAAALPKTADGVIVVPGMKVFYRHPIRDGNPVVGEVVGSVNQQFWFRPGGGIPYFVFKGYIPYFYSKEAAEASPLPG